MVIQLPRGAQAIARAGLVLCDVVTRHPLVPATDPDPTRQALYAAIQAACAALKELVPDRFVDPGQNVADTFLTDAHGVETPTRYRANGGRLTYRITRGGVVSFASVGLTPFNAITGVFTDGTGAYATIADFYDALMSFSLHFYGPGTTWSLERIEQTQNGNLTVVTPAGTFASHVGPGLFDEQPLWIVSTCTIRTSQAGRELKFKMPGSGFNLGKQNLTPDAAGDAFQKLAAVLQAPGGGPMAYNGRKPSGLLLLSVSDNKREYRRLTR